MVYNDEHEIAEINQITDTSKDIGRSNNSKKSDKSIPNKTHINYTYGELVECGEFGHLAKECNITSVNTNQFNDATDQVTANPFINAHSGPLFHKPQEKIKYPTKISQTKPPILTHQITTDFQLSQKACNQLSSQMTEMTETNKLLKKAVQNTYKRLTNEQKANPKNTPNNMKTAKI